MMISRKQKKWFSSNYIFIKILEKSSLLTSDWPRYFEFFFFFLILVYSLIIRSYYNRHVFSFATSNNIFLKYNKYTPCYIGTYYLPSVLLLYFFGGMRFVDLYSKYLPIQLGTSLPTYLPACLPTYLFTFFFQLSGLPRNCLIYFLLLIGILFSLPEFSLFDFSPQLINYYFYILIY
jgi:hypothetical protein